MAVKKSILKLRKEDCIAPELWSLYISSKNVGVGNKLEVTSEVIDNISGVKRVKVSFSPVDGVGEDLETSLSKTFFNSKSSLEEPYEDGLFHGFIDIAKQDLNHEYLLSKVWMKDYAGNTRELTNPELDKSETNEHLDAIFTDIRFFVKAQIDDMEDKVKPELKSISLSASEVVAGDTIEVKVDATDDLSGVEFVTLRFSDVNQKGKNKGAVLYKMTVDEKTLIRIPYEDGLFHGFIHTDEDEKDAKYILSSMTIEDFAHNSLDFENPKFSGRDEEAELFPEKFADLSFRVKGRK